MEGGLWLLAVIVIVAHIAVLARLARRGEQQTETSRRLFEMLHRQLLLPKRFGLAVSWTAKVSLAPRQGVAFNTPGSVIESGSL